MTNITSLSLSRRSLTLGLAASTVAAAAKPAIAAAAAEPKTAAPKTALRTRLPLIASRKVGAVEVTALSDGFIDLPFGVFTGAAPIEIEAAFAARFARPPSGMHRMGFTVWLVDDGERRVLIDTGYAGGGPNTGRLLAALAALGIAPQSISAVLITHMHADHISGLVTGGQPVFPNAEVFIHRADVVYFTDPVRAAAAPELLKSSFEAAARVVASVPRLQRFDGERALTRAISVVDLRGHTPGHSGYRIADGGESLLIVGDALFHPALHPARTDIGIAFEPDPAAAAAMRRRLFPQAAEERALIAATHMPFPGFGRIVREGAALTWAPADWQLG
jgi:glyoxylase-like metal-dependent hydrolase (beta-lactamase superfamily II)